jgi:cysteinyl-tRNA synthetase
MAFELKLYDTLTRDKRPFKPIDPANVRMYVCGPTVYDFAHIGNARPVIVFDVLYRLLRHVYGDSHVTYVRNITDVDDKINARAAERGVDIRKLTNETYENFKADVAALGCLPPTVEPRATEHIAEMRDIIERLIKSGYAYVAEDHVLFDVPSMPDYGKLSNRSLDEMVAGARVEVAPYKRNSTDFVLWKPSKPGEPSWPSPAGIKTPGRPGWHIECSAMADRWLWTEAKSSLSHEGLKHPHEFDIHGGGIDLVFPHHENEIAQSRCAFDSGVMANYWMHNGFLQVEGEKMSKSLGNFVTINELLTGWHGIMWPGAVIRFAMLSTQYRQPFDFTQEGLEQAHIALRMFATFAKNDDGILPSEEFLEALKDDLNTPLAIAELHRLLKISRGIVDELAAKAARPGGALVDDATYMAARQLAAGLRMLGIEIKRFDPHWLEKQVNSRLSIDQRQQIESLVVERELARKAKDFKESDRIRDELAAMGVVLKDSKEGTTWEIAR